MTEEQMRLAIAEACGWKPDKRGLGWLNPHGYYAPEPDYLADLNAMHEAEKSIDAGLLAKYTTELLKVCGGPMSVHFATAAQRAEAFLKTKGILP